MADKQFYVYLLTNKPYGTFYIGFTSNLAKRLWEHKEKLIDGFSKQYNTTRLVYYEIFQNAEDAIRREKRFKRWTREWKIEAVNKFNPDWNDLYEMICS